MSGHDMTSRLVIARTRMDDAMRLANLIDDLCEQAERDRRRAVTDVEPPALEELEQQLAVLRETIRQYSDELDLEIMEAGD